ncbi:MAG: response regulator [Candidatus Mcinerneyibacterium aminivorans]|uniref:histidine kinase n=1 Tax=Candidatus Mcinerneyibacterium aminivorans TaxID=2703815 RepID=A0A5D0MKZ6_9BACT|nr:MAG: response regulator [Candidatus Mcinerneyibacterium aminivorans]
MKNKIIIIFTTIALIFSSILIINSYKNYKKDFIENLKKNSIDIAKLGSKNIDAEKCKELIKKIGIEPGSYSEVDSSSRYLISKEKIYNIELDSSYQEIVGQLNSIKNLKSEYVLYAYILIPTGNEKYARILVDADLPRRTVKKDLKSFEETKLIAHIGKLYDISNQPTTVSALKKRNVGITDSFIYDREYKSKSIMVFAPIRDENNNYIATLGLDFSDKMINQILHKNIFINIITSILLTVGVIIIIIFSSSFITKPLENITRATKKVKNQQYDFDLPVKRNDDIGILASNFESMAGRIKTYEEKMTNLNNKLKIENEELMITLKSIGDGVISVDVDGQIILMNEVAEELTGWNFEETVNLEHDKILYFLNKDSEREIENPISRVLEIKQKYRMKKNNLLLSRDGSKYLINGTASPIFDSNNSMIGVVFVFKNVTEIEKYKKELEKNEKLESIAHLAGGIAHDFNNYLMGVLGSIDLIKIILKRDYDRDKLESLLDSAEKSARKAKELTKQLLVFSKGGEPSRKPINLEKLLNKIAEDVFGRFKVQTKVEINEHLFNIYADGGQLKQVFRNIFKNSLEATDHNGYVNISAENVMLHESDLIPELKGQYVKILIEDNGKGIKKENLNKVFDPFYTEKQNRNGLGLSIAYSIIARHNGEILIDSQKGKYTKVTIYLPVSGKIKGKYAVNDSKNKYKTKILIVEGNKIVAETLENILINTGCKTVLADTGKKAIKEFNKAFKENRKFDLVIVDYVLKGEEKGVEIFEKLKMVDPEIKGVISSGFMKKSILSNYKEYGFIDKLEKPYKVEDIYNLLEKMF